VSAELPQLVTIDAVSAERAEVLGHGGCKVELIADAVWSAQSQPIELQDAFQMREQHRSSYPRSGSGGIIASPFHCESIKSSFSSRNDQSEPRNPHHCAAEFIDLKVTIP
jgi:hypothetical protein